MDDTPKRVLVAEDEKPLAHALQLKLEREGFQVTVTNNGQACLDALQAGEYDVVLLDLMMPLLDGFQVLERLKASGKPFPAVFALSNLSQHEDEERVMSLGASKYFIKSNTSLSRIVEEVQSA